MRIGRKLPGVRSNTALLITSAWAILGLFIFIIGHLAIIFFAYGLFTDTDALAELGSFIPVLSEIHFYIVAALAIPLDIWIIISHKKQREYKIQR